MIESGSVRKYLVYAIGEILLVMIGILLALQVNNWNQNRMDRGKEQVIIRMLVEEMKVNREYLRKRVERHAHNEKNSIYLLNRINPVVELMSPDTFSLYLSSAINNTGFSPISANFNRFIQGEEFNLIRFDSLKILFNGYHRRLQSVQEFEDYLNSLHRSTRQVTTKHIPKLNTLKMINFGSFYEVNLFKELIPSRFEEHPEMLMSSRDFEDELSTSLFVTALTHRVTDQLISELGVVIKYIEEHYSFSEGK